MFLSVAPKSKAYISNRNKLLSYLAKKAGVKIIRENSNAIRESASKAADGKFRRSEMSSMKDSALSELATHSNIRTIDYARDRKGRIHVFIVDKNDIMNSKELFGFESFKYAHILPVLADRIDDGTITTTTIMEQF